MLTGARLVLNNHVAWAGT